MGRARGGRFRASVGRSRARRPPPRAAHLLAAVFATTGCSSSDDAASGPSGGSGAPDFAALEAKLTTPTGTFGADQGPSIRDALSAQSSAARQNVLPGAGGSSADHTVDGTVYAHLENPPLLEIVSIHLAVSGKESAHFDVDYLVKDDVTTCNLTQGRGECTSTSGATRSVGT